MHFLAAGGMNSILVAVFGHDTGFPGRFFRKDFFQKGMMKGMTGFMGNDMPQQGKAQQRKITDTIQKLMTDKFILKTQPARVQHAIFIHDDGIVEGAALGQTKSFQLLDLVKETESAGTAYFVFEKTFRDFRRERLALNHGVIEFDGTRDFVCRKGKNGNGLSVFFKADGFLDHQNTSGSVLLDNAGFPHQPGERRRTAVHDGHFMAIDLHQGIVDGKSGKTGHQVLDGGYDKSIDPDNGRQTGIDHPVESGGNAR